MVGKRYHTRQCKELLEYLKSKSGEHFAVMDIYDHFKKLNINLGVATIYRHLERMVKDGLVRKYVVDSNSPACFEFIGDSECCQRRGHIHLKCLECGHIEHLDCNSFGTLLDHIDREHDFKVDLRQTVLYGLCNSCKARR